MVLLPSRAVPLISARAEAARFVGGWPRSSERWLMRKSRLFLMSQLLASIGNVSARRPAHDQAQCIGDNPIGIQERMGQCRAAKKSEKALTADFHGCTVHGVYGYTSLEPPTIKNRQKETRHARGLQVLFVVIPARTSGIQYGLRRNRLPFVCCTRQICPLSGVF